MICIKCYAKSTNVINSRPHKKQSSVWRRRQCPNCHALFTTTERPALLDNREVHLPDSTTKPFSLGKLTISIARAFAHDQEKAAYGSLWLAQTVETTLSSEHEIITPDDIAAITHYTLKNFDELAAVQYAATHQLISAARRRGRPSLLPHERGHGTDESPSR